MCVRVILIKKILILLTLLCFLPGLHAQEENIVNIYNWADYIGTTTIADFEREFGIKVNYDIYDTTEMVDAKLMAGRTGYDVIIHASCSASCTASRPSRMVRRRSDSSS